jgi:hypothetical protein
MSPYFKNLFFCQNVLWVSFSNVARKMMCLLPSPLIRRVLDVLLVRPKKKMGKIAARRIVAMVAHEHSIGNWSIQLLPSKTMSKSGFPVHPEKPIPSSIFTSRPRPAFIGTTFFHLAPKPNFDRLSLHNQIVGCAALLDRQVAGAFSFSQNPG